MNATSKIWANTSPNGAEKLLSKSPIPPKDVQNQVSKKVQTKRVILKCPKAFQKAKASQTKSPEMQTPEGKIHEINKIVEANIERYNMNELEENLSKDENEKSFSVLGSDNGMCD